MTHSFRRSPLPAANSKSGFFILVNSSTARFFTRLWMRANDLARPLLPFLHLFMFAMTVAILCGVVFANGHTPCWYDEICMLDPAYHRATEGVWRSIAQWDSIDVVPFAPNYPLLINILRFLITCFGVNFWILRGLMLVFGVFPFACLLVFAKKTGLCHSWSDILHVTYFSACCSFFFWAISIRPEALLLTVLTLGVFAWCGDHPVLLFISAFLVPICGIQWAVLLVPAVCHWLLFGGRIRNLVLVALALTLSMVATYAAYYCLGMWPSYVQEAGRIGGLGIFRDAVSRIIASGLKMDFSWLLSPWSENPAFAWSLVLFGIGTLAVPLSGMDVAEKKRLAFPFLVQIAVWLPMSLLARVNFVYLHLAPLPLAFAAPFWYKSLQNRHPMLYILLVLAAVGIGFTHWKHICKWFPNQAPSIAAATWLDEASLERNLAEVLPSDTVVLGDDAAYFAIRSRYSDFWSSVYAFDLPESDVQKIGAVLLKDGNLNTACMWSANWRRASFSSALRLRHPDNAPEEITTDDLDAAIAECWRCGFTELPLLPPKSRHMIRFRLFRPVFPVRE
jgi:hypothetical protein